MDKPIQFENNEPDKGDGEDLATRRINTSELNPAPEKELQTGEDAATVVVTRVEDPSATKIIPSIQEGMTPPPNAVEPPNPISTAAKPDTFSSPSTPPKDNRTPIAAIIAVAVVALVCICACTAIIITALLMIPTY